MTLRPAETGDEAALVDFLTRHEAGSMFPLTQLAAEGIGARLSVWLREQEGAVCGALMLTANDILLPQAPGFDWAGVRGLLMGRRVASLVGPDGQALRLREALGLPEPRHIGEEPGFTLDLAELVLPEAEGFTLVPLDESWRQTALVWRTGYLGEIFGMPPEEAMVRAGEDLARYIARSSHRILLRQGAPVAMTGFNAILPEVVQVGGVYTPPGTRGQGLARRAVALHLAEVRARGVKRGVLFAANAAAARAYRAIGFQPGGTMGVVEFAAPEVIA